MFGMTLVDLIAIQEEEMILAMVLGGMALLTPVIALVTYHQRKMAEIVHKGREGDGLKTVVAEVVRLREEVKSLRQETNANTIALDDLGAIRPLAAKEQPPKIEERMTQG